MEHYPEESCHFTTVKKILKGFNLVFAKSTFWRISVFIRENSVVQNLLLEFSTFCFYGLFLLSLLCLSFNNPEGRKVMHPKHRAHVLLPYINTKSCASCFICNDFYKNFVVLLRMYLQRPRSTPDSLKRVFNVFRRRPSFIELNPLSSSSSSSTCQNAPKFWIHSSVHTSFSARDLALAAACSCPFNSLFSLFMRTKEYA